MEVSGKLLKVLLELKALLVYKRVRSFSYSSIKFEVLCLNYSFNIFTGLGPALAFQFVLNSTRLGLYETVDQLNWTRFNASSSHSTVLCVFWGAVCGVAGSAIGCPLYMVKTQLQAQSHGKFAVGFQHGHTGMVDALVTTYRQQGMRGLWRGFEGMAPRTAVGSAIQMTTFSKCKDFLSKHEVCIIFQFNFFSVKKSNGARK